MKPLTLAVLGLLAFTSPSVTVADTVLWYNGDLPAGGGVVNEESSNIGPANTYEDFNVTTPGGWLVDRLWSNNSMQFLGVTSASWYIRSGMSAGNPGTIISSGTAFATQTPTGRYNASLGFQEYKIEITGLNVSLSPGQYWLSVSPLVGNDPISNGALRSYVSLTFGANAVGQPAGNNGGGFLYWPYAGYNYAPIFFNEDHSLGIGGAVVPEPSSWVLLIAGGILVQGRKLVHREQTPAHQPAPRLA